MVPTESQTLKSVWIWLLSWKVVEFSICLENWQFSLKSAWKLLLVGLKNNGPTNLICLCVFYACCILDFDELMGFGDFVIEFPVTTDPVIHIFFVNIEIRCMASYFIAQKRVYNTPDNDSIVLEKCNFVLDKSWNFISEKVCKVTKPVWKIWQPWLISLTIMWEGASPTFDSNSAIWCLQATTS